MAYKLVKDESHPQSRRGARAWRVAGAILGIAGLALICVAAFMLTDVEHKAYETEVEESYSSDATIYLSLAMLVAGAAMLGLAAWCQARANPYRRMLKGTSHLWQKAYVSTDELPFSEDHPCEPSPCQLAGSILDEDRRSETASRAVLCKKCARVVRTVSDRCPECGERVL